MDPARGGDARDTISAGRLVVGVARGYGSRKDYIRRPRGRRRRRRRRQRRRRRRRRGEQVCGTVRLGLHSVSGARAPAVPAASAAVAAAAAAATWTKRQRTPCDCTRQATRATDASERQYPSTRGRTRAATNSTREVFSDTIHSAEPHRLPDAFLRRPHRRATFMEPDVPRAPNVRGAECSGRRMFGAPNDQTYAAERPLAALQAALRGRARRVPLRTPTVGGRGRGGGGGDVQRRKDDEAAEAEEEAAEAVEEAEVEKTLEEAAEAVNEAEETAEAVENTLGAQGQSLSSRGLPKREKAAKNRARCMARSFRHCSGILLLLTRETTNQQFPSRRRLKLLSTIRHRRMSSLSELLKSLRQCRLRAKLRRWGRGETQTRARRSVPRPFCVARLSKTTRGDREEEATTRLCVEWRCVALRCLQRAGQESMTLLNRPFWLGLCVCVCVCVH
ncbi:Protein of unknown function [Gryllus bimaculatus]|nr:Protein of unknown function [Gryllus bimaculatus]